MRRSSPPPAAKRARTARGAERLRRLQTTAAEMFLSCGYEGVSVDGLIDRVGGSRRNVYGPCGGKQGLFVAAVSDLCGEISQALAALPMADAPVRSGLVLYGRRLLELVLQPRMLAMHRLMVSEGQRFPELARNLCETGRDNAATALGQWLSAHQARGELRQDRVPVELAQSFLDLVVSGPQLRALVGELPPGWTPAGITQHVNHIVDLFLQGAGPPASASPASDRAMATPPITPPRKTRP
ncbi:MAG: TetR/AcrR family transcriptional regulator C-terminal domain-containing protein [Ideonella sp.]|nr:TetR/AcrR family transcriptional regulator C-terminal domain-containing protein [Ideonella sp.]